jgi:tetratricopeptide (TPR) repeat protein
MHTKPDISKSAVVASTIDESMELGRGTVVDRFVVLETLGVGGMGVVYAAHDPELDRKVALKLLLPRAGGSAGGDTTRLMREGQALAKLSHPNVVAVHDVGTHGDRVWIAMEFVAGQTLAAWAKERPRRWSEVLAVLADVARGMAAAHGAGLVHRDLKPDNVMIGRDGRVRVMDFGLAHGRCVTMTELELASTLVSGTRTPPGPTPLGLRLTAKGAVQGTPAYMAPEQWQGQEEEAATDQFGWSVMAWELLYGERPFAGETVVALAAAVLSGERRPPPRGHAVPSWLRRVIERGLATKPAGRWPTMAALLSALERGKMRARVHMGVAALASVALLGAGAEGYRRWDIAQRVSLCEMRGAEIDKVWNDDARQKLRDAFMATGASYAATSAEKVMPWLDKQAVAWKEARTEICLNADVRNVWDDDLVDRAMWCLEDRQIELESLVAELGNANTTVVQKAVIAVSGLRTVKPCLDADTLRRQPTPPVQGREAMRDVRVLISRAHSLSLAGKFEDALEVATQAREQAAKVDWLPLLAAARAREGWQLTKTGAYEAAEAASREAYYDAARSGAWNVASKAAVDLVGIEGERAQYKAGFEWARHAEVALAQADDLFGLGEAVRLTNLSRLHSGTGAYAEAQALQERAIAIDERVLGLHHPDVALGLNNLANIYTETGGYPKALFLYKRALAIREQVLGPDHPDVAESLNNLGVLHDMTGLYADALALYQRALAINEDALGLEHPSVAMTLGNLAAVYGNMGAYAEARTLIERAQAIFEKALGPDHPAVATSLGTLAVLWKKEGAYSKAETLFERALAIFEKALGPGHSSVALTLNNLANLYSTTGAYTKARGMYQRALIVWEQALGLSHPNIALTLNNISTVYLDEGRPHDALPLLKRALTIYDAHEGVQPEEIEAHFNLARALLLTGDRVGALVEAKKAREGFGGAGEGKTKKLAEVEQWLAEHDRNP